MDESEFNLYIQKPRLKRLRRCKFGWDVILIIVAAAAARLCCSTWDDMKGVVGEVLLAAGMVPFLLSLPLILADMGVSCGESPLRGLAGCFQLGSHKQVLAYLFSAGISGVGIWCGLRGKWIWSALAEVFAEVSCIYGITTLFRIPTVQDDGNSSMRFLSNKERDQLERSGKIAANYARITTFALGPGFHEDMLWKYPADVPATFAAVEDEFNTQLESYNPRGAFLAHAFKDVDPGWNCVWYVASLGRCDSNYLSNHLLQGLFTCLSGAAQCNRFITEAAVDSLANLYFQSKNRKISQRIYEVWMVHEIADVRQHCYAAIMAVGEPTMCKFITEMNNLDGLANMQDICISRDYFTQHMCNVNVLELTDLVQICQHFSGSLEARLMSLIAACCLILSNAEIPGPDGLPTPLEIKTFLRSVDSNVLRDPLECHLAKELALEAITRIARVCGSSLADEDRHFIWDLAITQTRTSVFKQVRQGGKKALEAAEYQHSGAFDCFGGVATGFFREKGFSSIGEFLAVTLKPAVFDKVSLRLQVMERPEADIAAMFNSSNSADNLAYEPDEDPVFLLYAYLATGGDPLFDTIFIQERLNARDYFERYTGLLCIGALAKHREIKLMKKEACPGFVQTELISDARDLALVVLDDKGATSGTGGCCASGCCGANELDGEIQQLQSRRAALVKKELEELEERTKKFRQ